MACSCLTRTVIIAWLAWLEQLSSLDLKRLRKTETWPDCQVISSNISSYVAAVAWTAGAGSCSNRWDCCHEHRVAAIAGIAVLTTELQQSLGLLLWTEGCSSCWDCCYEHRVAASAGLAVLKRCGRSWTLPFLTMAADGEFCRWWRFIVTRNRTALVMVMKLYLEAVQDVCWCLHRFRARIVL